MKRLSATNYAQLLIAATKGLNEAGREQTTRRFIQLLQRHRAMPLLPRIFDRLQLLTDRLHHLTRVQAVSAKPIDEAELTSRLSQVLGPTKVDLSLNPELIGGLVLRIGDDLIDVYWRSQLSKLHQHLIQSSP